MQGYSSKLMVPLAIFLFALSFSWAYSCVANITATYNHNKWEPLQVANYDDITPNPVKCPESHVDEFSLKKFGALHLDILIRRRTESELGVAAPVWWVSGVENTVPNNLTSIDFIISPFDELCYRNECMKPIDYIKWNSSTTFTSTSTIGDSVNLGNNIRVTLRGELYSICSSSGVCNFIRIPETSSIVLDNSTAFLDRGIGTNIDFTYIDINLVQFNRTKTLNDRYDINFTYNGTAYRVFNFGNFGAGPIIDSCSVLNNLAPAACRVTGGPRVNSSTTVFFTTFLPNVSANEPTWAYYNNAIQAYDAELPKTSDSLIFRLDNSSEFPRHVFLEEVGGTPRIKAGGLYQLESYYADINARQYIVCDMQNTSNVSAPLLFLPQSGYAFVDVGSVCRASGALGDVLSENITEQQLLLLNQTIGCTSTEWNLTKVNDTTANVTLNTVNSFTIWAKYNDSNIEQTVASSNFSQLFGVGGGPLMDETRAVEAVKLYCNGNLVDILILDADAGTDIIHADKSVLAVLGLMVFGGLIFLNRNPIYSTLAVGFILVALHLFQLITLDLVSWIVLVAAFLFVIGITKWLRGD